MAVVSDVACVVIVVCKNCILIFGGVLHSVALSGGRVAVVIEWCSVRC